MPKFLVGNKIVEISDQIQALTNLVLLMADNELKTLKDMRKKYSDGFYQFERDSAKTIYLSTLDREIRELELRIEKVARWERI